MASIQMPSLESNYLPVLVNYFYFPDKRAIGRDGTIIVEMSESVSSESLVSSASHSISSGDGGGCVFVDVTYYTSKMIMLWTSKYRFSSRIHKMTHKVEHVC